MPDESQPLFCYCLVIGDREFSIQVTHEGAIHWDDYQQRRKLLAATQKHQVGGVFMTEPDKFTVSMPLDSTLLNHIRQAAEKFESDQWTHEDERQLDEQLLPLFWTEVNPRLTLPLERPAAATRPP